MRGPYAQPGTAEAPRAEAGPGWSGEPTDAGAADLSYAARNLQTEVAQLLARVDAVPDPALQRLAASVRRRSDVVTSTRRLLGDEPARPSRARTGFDLTETIAQALHSLREGSASAPGAIIASLPEAPVRVRGDASSFDHAVSRTSAILASAAHSALETTVALALTRAGARLDLTVPGVELSAAGLTEVVEAFLAATSSTRAASGVNVHVVAGRVCVVTDPVTATTSADETTVSALWELEGSLHDVA